MLPCSLSSVQKAPGGGRTVGLLWSEGEEGGEGSPNLCGAHSPVSCLISGYQSPSKASASSCCWEIRGTQGRQEGACRVLTPSTYSGWTEDEGRDPPGPPLCLPFILLPLRGSWCLCRSERADCPLHQAPDREDPHQEAGGPWKMSVDPRGRCPSPSVVPWWARACGGPCVGSWWGWFRGVVSFWYTTDSSFSLWFLLPSTGRKSLTLRRSQQPPPLSRTPEEQSRVLAVPLYLLPNSGLAGYARTEGPPLTGPFIHSFHRCGLRLSGGG